LTEVTAGGSPKIVSMIFGRYTDYVWGLRFIFTFCLLIFFYSLVMGYFYGGGAAEESIKYLEEILSGVQGLGLPLILVYVFVFLLIIVNNALSNLIFFVSGILFSVPPLYFDVNNGFVIGGTIQYTGQMIGVPLTILGLVPHGIIEIPTSVLSMAVGVSLGYQLINQLRGKGSLRAELRKAIGLFVWKIVPLLTLSALIEVTVTPFVLFVFGVG